MLFQNAKVKITLLIKDILTTIFQLIWQIVQFEMRFMDIDIQVGGSPNCSLDRTTKLECAVF
jgi:hypothetical protein